METSEEIPEKEIILNFPLPVWVGTEGNREVAIIHPWYPRLKIAIPVDLWNRLVHKEDGTT